MSFIINPYAFGAPAGPVTLAQDTFTDTNGTGIASHAMDVGAGWTLATGTLTIQSNQLTGASGGSNAVTDISATSYTASARLMPGCALIVRYASSDSFIFANLNVSKDLMELTRWDFGIVTVLASQAVALSEGVYYAVEVTVTPTNVTVTVDAGSPTSYSTALNAAATKVGVRIFNASRNIDDFLVTA